MSDEFHKKIPLAEVPSRLPPKTRVMVGAFLERNLIDSQYHIELQLYVEIDGRLHREVRLRGGTFASIDNIAAWLRHITWGDVSLLLNPERCWHETDGGFKIQCDKDFKQVLRLLIEAIQALPKPRPRR